jgi:GT2 family glycosyltransferase
MVTARIDLCIVHYNTTGLLERLLNTLHGDLESFDNRVWTLSIADNDSQDNFIEWFRDNSMKYKIDNLHLNRNIGYSAACNDMAANTKSDIIGLLNGDVWLSNNDVLNIVKIFDENPDIHILGPKQRDENGYITHAGIIGSNTKPKHRGWRDYDPEDKLYRDRINCVTISGSAYFVRRNVWESLLNNPGYKKQFPHAKGAFLPTPHYYEETFCSYHARHLGYNVVYDGTVSIGHSWHASSPKPGEGYSEADRMFAFSRKIFRQACDNLGIEHD